MHTLHTTDAFVLGNIPHGENNRVYSLFTRQFGYLYAHGQGVRELKNRNRYALATGALSTVTLVRGREVWRITSVQHGHHEHQATFPEESLRKVTPHERRAFALLQSFAPREEPLPHLFTALFHAHQAFHALEPTHASAIERVTALRILHTLGYVAPPHIQTLPPEYIETTTFSRELLEGAETYKRLMLDLINSALYSANS